MKQIISILLFAAILMGCGSSKNPVLLKKIDDLSVQSSNKSYSVSGKFIRPMALKVGQWVTYVNKAGEEKSISKTSIVGKDGDAWIIENYMMTGKEEKTVQICVKGMDKVNEAGDMDAIEFVWIKFIEDGKLQTLEGTMLSLMKGMYKKGLQAFGVKSEGSLDGGTQVVPAGTFSGCAKIKSEVSFLGSTKTSEGYYHMEVPISGMVKSISEDNDVMELVDFGLTGAVKSF
jgi:hypothetical protein